MNRQQVKNQSSYFDASPNPCNQPFAEETASDPGLLRWRWINHLRGLAINASLNKYMNSFETIKSFLRGRVTIIVGDIAQQHVDAVVNAANSTLFGGGGVDGAIHYAGGPQILEECKEIRRTRYPGGLPTGEAVITSGGNLQARYVIHTVGPIKGRSGGRDAELLAACYENSLALAVQHGLRSVAFPSISTGAFGYPREEAAAVSSEAIRDFLRVKGLLEEVRLVFYTRGDVNVFLRNHRFGEEN